MKGFIVVFHSLEKRLASLPNTWEADSIQAFNQTWLGLSYTGELYTIPFPVTSAPSKFLLSVEIVQISSNSSACLLLSAPGRVYSLGEDPENNGFLGHLNKSSATPFLIPDLVNIEQISLGKTHAGALSVSSSFFLWGKCPSLSSCTPIRQSFEMFTIQRFECGNNFSLLTTTGGYLYIVGQLGFTHKQPKSPAPIGAFSPPDIEKMCVTFSTAGYQFVVFINDRAEAFVFDGCLEIVKLPMQSYQKIETVRIIGDKILGICEDGYLIEWGLERGKDETDCNLYFFTGFGYKYSGKFKYLGGGQENFFVLADSEMPVEDKSEIIMPYKRTEYGKKLISKVKESVRISGKFDFMRNSIENSPVLKIEKNSDYAKCSKIVYAVNFILRKFFSEIKVFAYADKTMGMFKNRGILGLFFKNYHKNMHIMLAKAFENFLINVEIAKYKEVLVHTGAQRLFDTLNNISMYTGFQGLIQYQKKLAVFKVFSTLEQKTLKRENLLFRQLKVNLKLWKLKKVLLPKLKLSFAHGFLKVKKEFKQDKSCATLVNGLRKWVNSHLFSVFHSIKSYSCIMEMHQTVFDLHKDCAVSTLAFKLAIYKIHSVKPVFYLIKHLFIFSKLQNVLTSHLYSILSLFIPRIISPVLLSLQSTFLNLILREKLICLKEILYMSYLDNSIEHEIEMLSPIKVFNAKENQEETEIKCSSMNFPLNSNTKRKKSIIDEASDFQKYLLWYREFKTRPKIKAKKPPKESRPPWRPSGLAIKKTKNEDEGIKKNVERRRDYSESIRSSKSSFSSEESFCRRIGWDKEAYIKRFKERRVKELNKLVAAKSLKRTLVKYFLPVIKKIKSEANKKPKQLKNLVDRNWKIGFINIAMSKLVAFMKKKAIREILK